MNPIPRRTRILPSSAYPHQPPSPPPHPPPLPTALCKIAILSNDGIGKSLISKFIHRTFSTIDDDELSQLHSTTSTLGSCLSPNIGNDGSNRCSYAKKDVTLCHGGGERCVRVQLWDVNLNNMDDTTTADSMQSSILSLLRKCHAFIIAVRAPPPYRDDGGGSSSIASLRSVSCLDWPLLDECTDAIDKQMDFIRSITNRDNAINPSMAVMLTHAEEIVDQYSPRHWMELADRMSRYDVDWRLVSGMDVSPFQDDDRGYTRGDTASMASSKAATVTSLTPFIERMQSEQRKMMEDIDCAVEETFVSLIQSFLDEVTR